MGEAEYFRCCRTIRLDLLDLFGRGYVIEHCADELSQAAEQRRLRAWVTDALMVLTENTARFAGGRRMARRWAEGPRPADERSADEIAAGVMRRAGLRFAVGGMQGDYG